MTEGRPVSLVTGATGFLGRCLCKRLQTEGHRVIALGRHTADGPWDTFIKADISSDSIPLTDLTGVTTLFHLASKAHAVGESAGDACSYYPVIVEGTRRLLAAAKAAGVERFIYVSSVKAMGEGNPPGLPLSALDETFPPNPQSPYGVAKAEAEMLVRASGLPHAVIVRPVMVFGSGEKGNLPRMIEAVRRGRFPPIPDTGNRRSMIHVDDVVEFLLRAARTETASGKTYILAGPEALSTRQLYDYIRESLGMAHVAWSVPLVCLKAAASMGTFLGTLTGQRLPLDLETLDKLLGSAWYNSSLAERELGYVAACPVSQWLSLDVCQK